MIWWLNSNAKSIQFKLIANWVAECSGNFLLKYRYGKQIKFKSWKLTWRQVEQIFVKFNRYLMMQIAYCCIITRLDRIDYLNMPRRKYSAIQSYINRIFSNSQNVCLQENIITPLTGQKTKIFNTRECLIVIDCTSYKVTI